MLRGSADGMKYIITLLFYKRICDVYDEEVEEIKKEIPFIDEKIIKQEGLTRFFIPREVHFDEVRKTTVNVTRYIYQSR